MKYWFIPSNDNTYRIGDSIKENNGMADWRQSYLFSVGDTVFIFKPQPENFVRYKMKVIATNIPESETIEKESYWKDLYTYYEGLGNSIYTRFQLIEEYAPDVFPLKALVPYGLDNHPQSVINIEGTLLKHLLKEDTMEYGTDYPTEDESLYEGVLVEIKANKYERNPEARKKCIEEKGAKCHICGFDFEKNYGSIGKGFIHIHHIVPISSIGKEYELDVSKDLIPVCPNCHAMLHQKKGIHEAFTPIELKTYMKHRMEEETPAPTIHIGKIDSINEVPEIKTMLLNNMTLLSKTSILDLMKECFLEYGEQYPNMDYKDWMHIVSTFVHETTHHYELKINEDFTYSVASSINRSI